MDAESGSPIEAATGQLADDAVTTRHHELLGNRLLINSRIRFAVAGSFVLVPGVAVLLRVMEPTQALLLGLLAAFIATYNSGIFLFAGRVTGRTADTTPDRLRFVMYAAIVLDFMSLAIAVELMGGARSPFMAFYLLHTAVSCVILTRRTALLFTGLAFVFVALQVVLELLGVGPLPSFMAPVDGEAMLDWRTALTIITVYAALFALTAALLTSIARWLRDTEEELRIKNRTLQNLSRLRRDFLHVAVHNLRAPVGASLMLLDNLQEGLAGPLNERQADWVSRSRNRLDGMLTMLHDMKLLGDLETDGMKERMGPVDINLMLRGIVAEYAAQAEAAQPELILEPHSTVPPVLGIERLLREAVVNYVTNALRHATGTNQVRVRAALLRSANANWVRVEVRDEGPGIAPEYQNRLFQEFSAPADGGAGDDGGDGPKPGSGLGLSIVRRIVEEHGGRVGVESVPGSGSTFFLELPVAQHGAR